MIKKNNQKVAADKTKKLDVCYFHQSTVFHISIVTISGTCAQSVFITALFRSSNIIPSILKYYSNFCD